MSGRAISPWRRIRRPVACQHIADYYTQMWLHHKCIAWNLLRRGYGQWAAGCIERGVNNLYGANPAGTEKRNG